MKKKIYFCIKISLFLQYSFKTTMAKQFSEYQRYIKNHYGTNRKPRIEYGNAGNK